VPERITPPTSETPRSTPAGNPTLENLTLVTDQAYGSTDTNNSDYVPNSWGAQKDRIVRASSGDLFMTYISEGQGLTNRIWHLMHKAPNSNTWQEIDSGNAGTEPINIVLGADDSIHLFAWPGTQGKLEHIYSTDLGKTFKTKWLPGEWRTGNEQGYSGCGVNAEGDIAFIQTGDTQPGQFLWTYYNAQTRQWTFHQNTLDFRYTYAFLFPGNHNDLTIVAMRDVQRPKLGYSSSSGFNYIFNEIKYFYISNINNSAMQQIVVANTQPKNNTDSDITYLTDSYIDTAGRMHILYLDQYDGPHHAIIQNGKLIKNVRMGDISNGQKMRIVQDALGHFYIIAIDESGNYLNIYPGTASDTDGTQLGPVDRLNVSQLPGCSDYDFCHSPTFTVPRVGDPLSNTIYGVYGHYNQEIYFQINLRGNGSQKSQSDTSSFPLPINIIHIQTINAEEKRTL
jgi:hypothetical protein